MRTLVVFLALVLSSSAFAQQHSSDTGPHQKTKSAFVERLVVGGGFNLGYYPPVFIVGLSPQVGYRITDEWTAGLGVDFTYLGQTFEGQTFRSTFFGGSAFTRYRIIEGLMVTSEFRYMNSPRFDVSEFAFTSRQWVPVWLVGAGYYQAVGPTSGFIVGINYDLINHPDSPYDSSFPDLPIITMSFVYGLGR